MEDYKDWYSYTQTPYVLVEKNQFLSPEDIAVFRKYFSDVKFNIVKKMYLGYVDITVGPYNLRDKVVKKLKEIIEEEFKIYGLKLDMMTISNTQNGEGHIYHMDNCKYDSCNNIVPNHTPNRIISMSVSLTPRQNYTGGELFISTSDGPKTFAYDEGNAVIFTSNRHNPHWVKKVSSGERLVLLCWLKSSKLGYHTNDMLIRNVPGCMKRSILIGGGCVFAVILILVLILYLKFKKKPRPRHSLFQAKP